MLNQIKHKIMKLNLFVLSLLVLTIYSCDVRKSVEKDFLTGLTSKGDGISCEEVYLSDGQDELKRKIFKYGETFYVYFRDIKGFEIEDSSAFPGMQLVVTNEAGDTVMQNKDLYDEYSEGFNLTPLTLTTTLTVANPMHSGNKYKLFVDIWDKKGSGTFTAKMEFEVKPNDLINIRSNKITYDEIYLFSGESNHSIIDNKVGIGENVYLLFEGLKGFAEENGQAHFGLSIRATEANGNALLNETDLMGDTMMEIERLNQQLAPNFVFSGTEISNPVSCEIVIWDKKGEGRLTATFELNVE